MKRDKIVEKKKVWKKVRKYLDKIKKLKALNCRCSVNKKEKLLVGS